MLAYIKPLLVCCSGDDLLCPVRDDDGQGHKMSQVQHTSVYYISLLYVVVITTTITFPCSIS